MPCIKAIQIYTNVHIHIYLLKKSISRYLIVNFHLLFYSVVLRRLKKKRVFGHIETFQRHHLYIYIYIYIYICSTGDCSVIFFLFLPKIGVRELEEWIVHRNREFAFSLKRILTTIGPKTHVYVQRRR